MDSIRRLMREVEWEEEAAEKATKEANWSSLDTLVKMDKRKEALANAQETKNMLVSKLNVEKDVLAIKMELLHRRVANMLDVGDRSLDTLSEMCKALKKRLTSATTKKALADKKKLENESALAHQELQIRKVVEEFIRLKQEALENSKVIIVEMANLKDDSTIQNTIISSFKLLDTSIQEGSNNLNLLSSRFDRVMSLKREVELKEKAVEEAKEVAAKGGLDILAKVEELKQEQQRVKEANEMHARKLYAQKVVLAKDLKEHQIRISGVSNEGRTSLGVLDQLHRTLKMRLTEAFREENLANEEKLRKEILAQEVLAFEESQMLKLVEESEKLKKEESKLRDLFKQRESAVNILHGDLSAKHQDINVFIDRFDQPVPQLGGSSQTSSSLPF
ncbi:hypothetical protein SSX86_026874 [Deinandra increscens subsp. villosa]|uniref:Uncharacterized protein n=1 Tax=Deinandra increscens subsp. villosa TaxID=3103831 RepID=A0AAP0CFA2_9ASTR